MVGARRLNGYPRRVRVNGRMCNTLDVLYVLRTRMRVRTTESAFVQAARGVRTEAKARLDHAKFASGGKFPDYARTACEAVEAMGR